MSEPSAVADNQNPHLARNVGLFSLIVYGVGDMVGAGIYNTIGVAAGQLGNAVWMSFAVSMIAAMLTGLSYASLASRYPRAGGAAYVVNRAYQLRFLAYVVGLSVACSGLTSMAAGSNALGEAVVSVLAPMDRSQIPEGASATVIKAAEAAHRASVMPLIKSVMVVFILGLGVINFIGIRESLMMNLICTAVEVGGLLVIIAVGFRYLGSVNYLEVPMDKTLSLSMVMSGAVLTFYSFVGFEDMLNISEEVKDPTRNMPIGIITAIAVATVMYMLVSLIAVSVVPASHLADTTTKGVAFKQVMGVVAPKFPDFYSYITIFAVANTALLNYVMGSRLLYGMSRQGLVPRLLGKVHPKRRTPYIAIIALGLIVLALALIGNVKELASATSILLLSCFCLVNIALVILKFRPDEAKGRFEIPAFIPILGSIVCVALVAVKLFDAFSPQAADDVKMAPLIALALVAIIAALYFVLKPKAVDIDSAFD